jgi:SPX domain protein involved in polyphosphate accumulation
MLKNYINNSEKLDFDEKRYEKKYVCDVYRFNNFLSWIYNFTDIKKKYSKRNIKSIYFDNYNFDSAKDNLIGLSNREKVRLRWYNDDLGQSILEIKKKIDNYNQKNRQTIEFKKKNIFDYNVFSLMKELNTQTKKISEKNLTPIILISYDREYYENINGIRLTIDSNLTFNRILGSNKINFSKRIKYPRYIIELKFGQDSDYQILNFLKNANFINTRNSKYILGLSTLDIIFHY